MIIISQHLSSYIHSFWQLMNACKEVEQHLNGHSPENYDPIGWSNFIKKTMGTFKRLVSVIYLIDNAFTFRLIVINLFNLY